MESNRANILFFSSNNFGGCMRILKTACMALSVAALLVISGSTSSYAIVVSAGTIIYITDVTKEQCEKDKPRLKCEMHPATGGVINEVCVCTIKVNTGTAGKQTK
jgi:hypothetical protein